MSRFSVPHEHHTLYVTIITGPSPAAAQDYISFAKEYSITAPFRDISGRQTCVICQTRKASGVFFPCEHKCACRRCIEHGGFGKPGAVSKGGSLCPICW